MLNLKQILKSKTVWTFILMGAINGLDSVKDTLNPQMQHILNTALPLLGILFRAAPVQVPGTSNEKKDLYKD